MRKLLPMKLQFFAEPGDPGKGDPPPADPAQPGQGGTATTIPQIDYEKIAQLVAGKHAATEESVIKGYLKQQGLTKEQMDQAIATFKQQQAANQPDINALQTQASQAQAIAQQKTIENAAILQAVEMGIEAKTIPYILKMVDFNQVMGQDGNINDEAMKNALNKVLEDVPALKPQTKKTTGFVQVGASGSQQQSQVSDHPITLKDAVSAALKK